MNQIQESLLLVPLGQKTEAIEILPIAERTFVLKSLAQYEYLIELLLRFDKLYQFESEAQYQDYLRRTISRSMTRYPMDTEGQMPVFTKELTSDLVTSKDGWYQKSYHSGKTESVRADELVYSMSGVDPNSSTAAYNRSLEQGIRKRYLDLVGNGTEMNNAITSKMFLNEEEVEEITPPRFLWTADSYGNIKQLNALDGTCLNDFGQKWHNKTIYKIASTKNSKFFFSGDE